ncbi:hypothetical protein [Streptomyces sp. NRRL S-350]|uniref:hypothetical protein n=1 Tax=Streptomyces sp. NRRL S-350 TaxID=1463902 RepID=UPI0004BFB191|nr:hypothetical protein [Streptomyces sp. NRRL S-350]
MAHPIDFETSRDQASPTQPLVHTSTTEDLTITTTVTAATLVVERMAEGWDAPVTETRAYPTPERALSAAEAWHRN